MLGLSVRRVAFAGVVAALYVALTFAVAPIAFGPLQFRISEALTILPFFFPVAVPGLFVGCAIANWLLSPYGILDVVVGSAASLIAGLCTMLLGRLGRDRMMAKVLACTPPVIVNAVMIGALITWSTTGAGDLRAFISYGLWVGLGQLAVLYALGLPLLIYMPRAHVYDRLLQYYNGGTS